MPAVIQSTLLDSPGGLPVIGAPVLVGVSRDDLRSGYQVELESVNVATFYEWALEFTPTAPDGTASAAVLLAPELSTSLKARFNVDFEGPYLVRLTVDKTLPTEDTQYVRMRSLTRFADVHLVAGGERRDIGGVIPVDVDPKGWSQEQNRNVQRLLAMVRRGATSGRSLYVDSNRGRDSANTPNDFTKTTQFPGSDPTDPTGSGVTIDNEGFGDFSTVQAAIDYAMDYAARGEPAPSYTDPYYVFIQPGLYVEDLTLQSHVHLIGLGPDPLADFFFGKGPAITVQGFGPVIRTLNAGGASHTYSPTGDPDTDLLYLEKVLLENTDPAAVAPVLTQTRGLLILQDCTVIQRDPTVGFGAFAVLNPNPLALAYCYTYDSSFRADNPSVASYAITMNAENSLLWLDRSWVLSMGSAIRANASLYDTDILYSEGGGLWAFGGPGSFAFHGYPTGWVTFGTNIQGDVLFDAFGAPPASKVGNVKVEWTNTSISGSSFVFDAAGSAGTTTLNLAGISGYAPLTFPSGLPTSLGAYTWGTSLQYDNLRTSPVPPYAPVLPLYSQLAVGSVQDALDTLVSKVNPFYTHGTISTALPVYPVTPSVSYIGVDTVTPAAIVRVLLPTSAAAGAIDGRVIYIKDEAGGAGVPGQQIDVYVGGGIGTIDGVIRNGGAPLVLNTNYASLTLMCRGVSGGTSHWFVI